MDESKIVALGANVNPRPQKCDKFIFHVGRKTVVFVTLGSWKLRYRQELIAKTDIWGGKKNQRVSICHYCSHGSRRNI